MYAQQSVLDVDGTEGLSKQEIDDLTLVGNLIRTQRTAVDSFIRAHGMTPDPDEAEKAMQIILIASTVTADEMDSSLAEHIPIREVGFFGAIIKGIGSIFKKKEGGTKVGNFFRKLFGKKGGPGAPSQMEQAAYLQEQQRIADEKAEAEKKKKKQMQMFIGIGAAVVIVIILIVVLGRRKK